MSHSITGELNKVNYKKLDEVISSLAYGQSKMLLISASELDFTKSFLHYLLEKLPTALIDLLVQKETVEHSTLEDIPNLRVLKVARHGKKSFKISPRGVWAVMNNGYDSVWMVSDSVMDIQNNRSKLYMLLSGAQKFFLINAGYLVKEYTRKTLFFSMVQTLFEKIFSFVQSWFVALPLYVVFYLIGLILKLRRKVLKK